MDRMKKYVKAFKRAIIKSFARIAKKGGNIGKVLYLCTVLPVLLAIDVAVSSFEQMITHKKLSRVAASVLVFTMVFTSVGLFAVYADQNEDNSTKATIVSFETLSDEIANQDVEIDATEEDIFFPDALTVIVEKSVKEDETETDETEEELVEDESEEVLEEETTDESSEEETETEDSAEEESSEELTDDVISEETDEAIADEDITEDSAVETEEIETEEIAEEDIPATETTDEAPVEEVTEEILPETEAGPEVLPEETPVEVAEPETDPSASLIDLLFPSIVVKAAGLEETEKVTVYNEEVVLYGLQWKLVPERSSFDFFDTSEGGLAYVYVPVIPSEYDLACSLPTITVKVKEPVAFEQSTVIDGAVVTIKADEGVFPEDATLFVRRASEEETSVFENAVENLENREMGNFFVVDITVFDEDGVEIQPNTEKGNVYVSITMPEISAEETDANLYHIPDSEYGATDAEKLDTATVGATAEAAISSFSLVGVNVSSTADVLGNDGYPYGKNLGQSMTLAIRLKDGAVADNVTYQWQNSADKVNWTDIEGANAQEYTEPTPQDGMWYRCIVNTHESKPVQVCGNVESPLGRYWTRRNSSNYKYYISNGTMAYSVNGNRFDVTGLYQKDGTTYMLQTVYAGSGWEMNTAGSGAMDGVYFRFADSDGYALFIDADLGEGQNGFSFGSDTQLGNYMTSGSYSDSAALEAIKNDDNTLKQVAMIGAASSEEATDTDPAFVITPITRTGVKFWLGVYYSRQHFSYNTSDSQGITFGDVTTDGVCTDHVALKCLRTDSGMTMSWNNVASGGVVSFLFSVGDVASTGAVGGKVNYESEVIEGFEPGEVYEIVVDGDTTGTVYVITASAEGSIPLEGTDESDPQKNYSFLGKNIIVGKQNSNDTPAEIEIVSRPEAVEADTAGTDMDIEAQTPAEVGQDAIVSSTDSITLNLDTDDARKMSQQYRIYDADGQEIEGYGWISPDANGQIVFEGLNDDTEYVICSRIKATRDTPASLPTAGIVVKTMGTIEVTGPAIGTELDYNGRPRSFGVTTDEEDVEITYSTDLNEEYTSTVPTFKNAGTYTVYYKATKPGFRTTYGSYTVTIDKLPKEDEERETAAEITFGGSEEEGILDLSSYLTKDETIVDYEFEGDVAEYITGTGIDGKKISYEGDIEGIGVEGYVVVTVHSTNYEDYRIRIPLTGKAYVEPVEEPEEPEVLEEPEEPEEVAPIIVKPVPDDEEAEDVEPEKEPEEVTPIIVKPVPDDEETEDAEPEEEPTEVSEEEAEDVDTELVEETPAVTIPDVLFVADLLDEEPEEEPKAKTTETELENTAIDKGNIVDSGEIWDEIPDTTKTRLLDILDEVGGEIIRADETLSMSDENADKVVVKEKPVAFIVGEGAVVITMELVNSERTSAALADAGAVAKAILTEEQLQAVATGSVLEIKVEVTPMEQDAVSETDQQVIGDGVAEYAESNPNMVMADYIDISMYFRIDDADWEQITETEAFDIVIDIPQQYRGLGSKYYIMRAHEGKSTLLDDRDNNEDTVTISTGQFSTYALIYDEIIAAEETVYEEDACVMHLIILILAIMGVAGIIVFQKNRKVVYVMTGSLAAVMLLLTIIGNCQLDFIAMVVGVASFEAMVFLTNKKEELY